jgi:hypothetical protein
MNMTSNLILVSSFEDLYSTNALKWAVSKIQQVQQSDLCDTSLAFHCALHLIWI